MLLIELDIGDSNTTGENKKIPVWSKADWGEIRREMELIQSRDVLRNLTVEEAWALHKNTVSELVSSFVPLRNYKPVDRPPWMTSELLREIRRKRHLWKKYKTSPTQANHQNYKEVEKLLYRKIRKAKKTAEQRIAADKINTKPFFSYLRGKTKSRTGVGPLVVEGETISAPAEMAEELNKYFATVFQPTDTATPLPAGTHCKVDRKCLNATFKPSEVRKVIRKMKKYSAPGPDGVSSIFLHETAFESSLPLSIIFNKSMETGKVPEDWRTANVTPIFKKGSKKAT